MPRRYSHVPTCRGLVSVMALLVLGGSSLVAAASAQEQESESELPPFRQPPLLGPNVRSGTAAAPLAFEHVTVVDVQDGRLLPDQTVVVVGNRVQTVGPARTVGVPRGAQVVAGEGKYLIPGLWDMHVHVEAYPDIDYSLFLAHGVTGIRDMGSPVPLDTVRRWQREVTAGVRIGPRQLIAGPSLNGQTYTCPHEPCTGPPLALGVTDPDEAQHLVDSLKAAGVDFIKVRAISREVYLAVVAEARRLGIPFEGHLSEDVTATEASDSGQRTIEHFHGAKNFLAPCVGKSATVETCTPIAAQFARNNTWFDPTVVLQETLGTDYERWRIRDRLRYWPASVLNQAFLPPLTEEPAPNPNPDMHEGSNSGDLDVIQRAGLPLLAGSDADPAYPELVPGFTLHDELALLVRGGLAPLRALQAATINPAKYLKGTDSLGTVAPGKLADLVLLDADPLADIHNTMKIRAVVANGRYFDRPALDALLADLERAARAP